MAEIRFEQHPDAQRVDVLAGDAAFTAYRYPDTIMKPVLWPLLTARGTPVTRGFPLDPRPGERADHPHHVGLWFNYGDVNGLDFWNNSYAIPAARRPKMGRIRHRSVAALAGGAEEGRLDTVSDWVDAEERRLLVEETSFRFRSGDGLREIDRVAVLRAGEQAVPFPDNKEGMLAIRVARWLEHPSGKAEVFLDAAGKRTTVPVLNDAGVNGRYRSSEGIEGEDVWGTRARWMKLSARREGEAVSVVILDHPENPGSPTYWHARGYGLYAANPLGQAPLSNGCERLDFALPAGGAATFRYRVLIASDVELSDEELNRRFDAFAR